MTYTPRRLIAWDQMHARVGAVKKADDIEVAAAGAHPGKGHRQNIKKLRELL